MPDVKFTNPPDEEKAASKAAPVEQSDTILIHVVEDGFTAHGKVWYRGQELEYDIESSLYQATQDRHGHSWLDMDDRAQMRTWGQVMFRRGSWPGSEYEDTQAAEAERRRARTPPSLPPAALVGGE